MAKEVMFTDTEINYNRVLKCAMDIGEHMLVSGIEAGKVEDSISRICRAYGAFRVDALSITTSIIVTIETPSGEVITQTRRITNRTYDFMRIEALNRLSRIICETRPDFDYIEDELHKIDGIKPLRCFWSAVAFILFASAFAVFFGGNFKDAVAAAIAGAVVFVFNRYATRLKSNRIVFNLLVSIITGAVCILLVNIGIGQNLNYIMIGVIMLLIPGMAMTGAIEDLIIGDTITGLLRLCEAIIAGCAIAAGFAVATYSLSAKELINLTGGISQNGIIQLITAFVSSGCYALMLGMKRPKRILTAGIGGFLGWGAYILMMQLVPNDFGACFIAAAIGALYAQIMARVMRAPAMIFLVPAVIPLVPGRALFYTFSSFMHGADDLVYSWGMTTLLEALAIALGMVVVLIAFTAIVATVRRINLRKKL